MREYARRARDPARVCGMFAPLSPLRSCRWSTMRASARVDGNQELKHG